MLHFEHILQVNDLSNPLMLVLNREQLWQGLQERSYNPVPFQLGLESCSILSEQKRHPHLELNRLLNFGNFKVQDHVILISLESVCTHVAASEHWPESQALIQIEEPEPYSLFLRFTYTWQQEPPQTDEDKQMHALRTQAYEASDKDLLSLIRNKYQLPH